MKTIRCAIYTRKSSDDGLEQDFNSLHAQRQACAAYVMSQASEGWELLPRHYDDGGQSGGTLERPALQCLLADVARGQIDIIVVYKVDRLTRSLIDFAKLVEAFDAAEVSFVSVTQSFNTTTSIGRLTLNMLLSFAQFEREVTAERIRDKIAASKAKGMWMGGVPPLGYRPDGRSLTIVESHAKLVRDIYRRYRETGNVTRVAQALAQEGIVTPRRQTGTGKSFGGCAFTRGHLYAILKNPIYAGDIPHKGTIYTGNHQAIIIREEWKAVQQQLADNTRGSKRTRQDCCSLLAGLLFDQSGNLLQSVHTTKGSKRYRYYVSQEDVFARDSSASLPLRIPAREIEHVVRQEVVTLLADPLNLIEKAGLEIEPVMLGQIQRVGAESSATVLGDGAVPLRNLLVNVVVHPQRLVLSFSCLSIAELFGLPPSTSTKQTFEHTRSVNLQRSGMAIRLIDNNGARAGRSEPDATLVHLILKARDWWEELAQGETNIARLSLAEGVTASWMTRVVRLACLAPDVVDGILSGNVRAGVDGKALLAPWAVNVDWERQVEELLPGDT